MHPYLNTAIKAARAAGTIITRNMDRLDRVTIETKSGPTDYVTNVDREAESEIVKIIKGAYHDHGIIGEEGGITESTNPLQVTWVIDPIDGTQNFVRGIPHFAVSIGILSKGQLEHAVVFDPVRNELFTATRNSGAQLDSKRIRVGALKSLEHSLLSYHASEPPSGAQFRILGSAALDLAYVAAGRLDGYLESGLSAWDLAAGALLVREAGGYVGDYAGEENFLTKGEIVAANAKLYPELLARVKAAA